MNPKERLNELEQHYRACACRSATPFFSHRKYPKGAGHATDETGNFYRTYYQHDRDKVLYSRSFRRLRLKTQIFPEHTADHLRTRLDHTLEVAQIARHFARQLGLNEDLVDAIALAHDIGHPPFAHSGEKALHRYLLKEGHDGFKHNWQGIRVVDKLEKVYPEINGLNLTRAVRLGILKHTTLSYKKMEGQSCFCGMDNEIKKELNPSNHANDIFEIQVIRLADEFAQVIHDFEDALVSGSLSLEDCVKHPEDYPLISECIKKIKERGVDVDRIDYADRDSSSFLLAQIRSELIYQLTLDVTNASLLALDNWEKRHLKCHNKMERVKIFNRFVKERKKFPSLIVLDKKKMVFHAFTKQLLRKVIRSEQVSRMDGKADYIVRHILDVYCKRPRQVCQSVLDQYKSDRKLAKKANIRQWPDSKLEKLKSDQIFLRAAVDYIAGMTDRFALREYDQLYSAYPRAEP